MSGAGPARTLRAALRRVPRLAGGLLLLAGGLMIVLLAFPMMSREARDATVARWSRLLLIACGLHLHVHHGAEGEPVARRAGGRMLVANHVSWLDIFAINAVAPSRFIAKADIARWPLVGALVGRVGTIFLERGRRHAVHDALQKVAVELGDRRRVAVFPEGTTGHGDSVLPFHANLIQAAVSAGVPIDPVGIRYRGRDGEGVGGPGQVMEYVGEITFLQSYWRVIGAPGICVDLHVGAEIPANGDPATGDPDDGNRRTTPASRLRNDKARAARAAISRMLDLPLEDSLPEVVRALRAKRQ